MGENDDIAERQDRKKASHGSTYGLPPLLAQQRRSLAGNLVPEWRVRAVRSGVRQPAPPEHREPGRLAIILTAGALQCRHVFVRDDKVHRGVAAHVLDIRRLRQRQKIELQAIPNAQLSMPTPYFAAMSARRWSLSAAPCATGE